MEADGTTAPVVTQEERPQSGRSVLAFWTAVALLLLGVGSSALPSPLYPVYSAEWDLTPLMLTGAFAIYVAALMVSLLTVGSLSDAIGRKPVLLTGALGVSASLVMIAFADGLAALLVARVVAGLSVGLLLGTLGATLLDHSLRRRPSLAGVLNGLTPPAALGIGALSSGALVQWGPAPERLVYLVFAAALVVVTVLVACMPETVPRRGVRLRSLVPRLDVPPASRRLLRDVVGALLASWALAGLYLSLVPSVLASVFGITNHFATGSLIAVFTGCGALAGFALRTTDPRRQQLIGVIALIVGPAVTVAFVLAGLIPGVVAGSAIAGVGFGAGFQSGLRMLLATAAPSHRAGLLSTIYVISYLAFGLPSIVAGLLDPVTGLVPAVVGYGAVVILAALVALVLQVAFKDRVEERHAAELVDAAR